MSGGGERTSVGLRAGGGSSPCRGGFTLVELLVVLAVVAILAGLLLPVLANSHRRAKRTVCLNQLRQLTLADSIYFNDHGRLPLPNDFVPSSTTVARLSQMAASLGLSVPSGPAFSWPKRAAQPRWFNCPMAAASGYAEGVTLGGGLYTGYAYVGGLENSAMVNSGFATLLHPEHLADAGNTRRGVIWLDVLDEFIMAEDRRFEFFHARQRTRYPDFRFFPSELDGIHRAWSDGSVEWLPAKRLNLGGVHSPDLQIKHLFGNFYF